MTERIFTNEHKTQPNIKKNICRSGQKHDFLNILNSEIKHK